MDLSSFDFDDSSYVPEANRPVEGDDPEALKMALPQLYDAQKAAGERACEGSIWAGSDAGLCPWESTWKGPIPCSARGSS